MEEIMTKNTIKKNEEMIIDAVIVAAEDGNEVVPDACEDKESETEDFGEESYSAAEEPGLIESVFNFIDTIKNDEVSREIAFEEFGEMCRDSINELCDILKEFPKIFEKE